MQERVVKRAEVGEGLWWHCGSTVEGSGVGEESEEWRCGGAACTSASGVEGSLFQKQRWDWGVCAVREGERVVVVGHSGFFDKLIGKDMKNCELLEDDLAKWGQ